ncbi:uncharacterized protein YukE [Nocardia sp. GAS34]|uniref:hypothetical protein n=1 Tax=Nocardia sp. GAS34 TaxID=3156305 RepID=UPI003D236C21
MTNPQQAASAYEQTYSNGASKAKSDLTRWLRDDDSNHFNNAKIWNGDIQFTGQSADDLLNEAVPGLDWFERALVRYRRVWDLLRLPGFDQIEIPANTAVGYAGDSVSTLEDPRGEKGEMRRLEGQYFDQQRGMDVDSLRKLAQQLQTAATGGGGDAALSQVAQEVAGVANAVPEVWQGQSGDAAQDHMAGFHSHADQQSQFVKALASALQGLPDVLLSIVKDKATFIGQFASEQMPVAGHAMKLGGGLDDPVSQIIGVAAGNEGNTNKSTIMQEQFHTQVTDSDGDQSHVVEDICKQWLQEHFGPAVREAVIAFVNQCVLADYYIKQAYKPVTDLLGNQDPAEFPKLQQNGPKANGNQQGPGSANTSTAGVQTSSSATQQNPAATNPTSVNPASSQSNSLSSLLSQAQQTMQTVESGVGQLSSTLQSGASQAASALQTSLSSLTGNSANAASAISSATGSKQLASFSLGGENLSVSQSSDGTVTTTVTGPDGKAQKFSMGIKNGVPFFTPGGDPSASGSKDSSHESTTSAQSRSGGGASLTSSASSASISTSDSSSSPHAGSSLGTTGSPTTTTTTTTTTSASTSTAGTASTGTSTTGSSLGSMPHMGGGSGGGKADAEHKSSGIVQPRAMWTKEPGSNRKPVIESAAAAPAGGRFGIDAADEQYVPNADFDPATLYEPTPTQSPPQAHESASGHQLNLPSPEPAVPAAAAAPAPSPRTDGVKIEIDMGDGK